MRHQEILSNIQPPKSPGWGLYETQDNGSVDFSWKFDIGFFLEFGI